MAASRAFAALPGCAAGCAAGCEPSRSEGSGGSPRRDRETASAVSKPIFAPKYAFFSIFRELQDSHAFAPFQIQKFSKISSNFRQFHDFSLKISIILGRIIGVTSSLNIPGIIEREGSFREWEGSFLHTTKRTAVLDV